VLTQAATTIGDLPWTARHEMPCSSHLGGPSCAITCRRRVMVNYPEKWMDSVDSMKTWQAGPTSRHALLEPPTYGERNFLRSRFGNWNESEHPADERQPAATSAGDSGYLHAYRRRHRRRSDGARKPGRGDHASLLLKNRLEAQRRSRR